MQHDFDPTAYRRIYLPRLFLCFLPSLALDALLLSLYRQGFPNPQAAMVGQAGLLFLMLLNQAAFKGVPIARYFRIKRLRRLSFVLVAEGEIIHHVVTVVFARWRMAAAVDTSLPEDGKKEYLCTDTYHIRRVESLTRKASGTLTVQGSVQVESVSAFAQIEDSGPNAGFYRKELTHHTIPGYYERMAEIQRALEEMR